MNITFNSALNQIILNLGTEDAPQIETYGPDAEALGLTGDVVAYLNGDPALRTYAERLQDILAMNWLVPGWAP